MTREELDVQEGLAREPGAYEHVTLIYRADYLALIAQARRAIELEELQKPRRIERAPLVLEFDQEDDDHDAE